MSLEYIRNTYGVPAYKDVRVRYTGSDGPQEGIIVGALNGYVEIKLDGQLQARPYHPTYGLEYLLPKA
ncbi:hypothetical protein SAMN04488503_2262 [Humidesulfovibrio mexicanus]|uniref:Uncharacterized protein n=1 Tax=Humidesulfovibrio mexicanus TaxID=147047 RepID=A0A239AWH2_9BACT|nr:hypothetical protein [Humidesulfovibrio mexicanus]SNR99859.1 hypothetical protein SAMN04488503_2262 [Humidesulfovibrio mexicanus]